MANPYYARSANFNAATTARGSEVKAEYDLIVAGFDDLDAAMTQLEADIANVAAGAEPGWGSSLDTRWYVEDTSASTSVYTGVLSPAPTGNNIQDGYSIEFLVNANNVGAATLHVDSLDESIPIVKVNGPAYQPLDADDMTTLDPVKLTFLAGNWVLRRSGGSGVEVGSFMPFGGSVVPDGYLECYGQSISRITYADLFAILGTTYGSVDANNFNLPDFRGRPLMGWDNIGGTPANVLLPLKYGKLAAGEPSGKAPPYATWLVKV